jgi:hypothetical protein
VARDKVVPVVIDLFHDRNDGTVNKRRDP